MNQADDWLHDLAFRDEIDPRQAAYVLVECGVTLSATDWQNLSPAGRALISVAKKLSRSQALLESGRDMDAALDMAPLDGGRQAARLMAHSAAQALAQSLHSRPVT